MSRRGFLCGVIMLAIGFGGLLTSVQAREAAFVEPTASSSSMANAGDAIKVEPKAEIDIGDSPLNIGRRTSLFFINQSNAPVKIEKITVNGDSNVTAEMPNDDCSKQGVLAPASRCSVDVMTTPTASGTWSVEVLMTHMGAGRLARAKLTGKTAGVTAADKKDNGLLLSTKDVKPVDFGDVNVGEGKVVRSALMVNDSPALITLYAIDVIEADNGLQRLDQGCAVDMELKAGESCPITLVWTPRGRGKISTDLIIRHSGQAGFAVIPIRGTAKGGVDGNADGKDTDKSGFGKMSEAGSMIAPPSLNDTLDRATERAVGAGQAVSSAALRADADSGGVHLIGTVGARALLFGPDGTTSVVQVGDEVTIGGVTVKMLAVNPQSADVLINGRKHALGLEAMQALVKKAKASAPASSAMPLTGAGSDGADAPSSKASSVAARPVAAPAATSAATVSETPATQ